MSGRSVSYNDSKSCLLRARDRKLVLPDGTEYYGYAFGAEDGIRVLELVFNTSMTGYQEILSDPSYAGQAIVMSYPLIGNYGSMEEDFESMSLSPGALIVREYTPVPSNFRSTAPLSALMKKYGVPGLSGVDTRKIVRNLRTYGTRMAAVAPADVPKETVLSVLSRTAPRTDTVPSVSTKTVRSLSPAGPSRFHVAVIDCGAKENILREFLKRGASLTVLPWNTSAEEILSLHPDGLFLSNGPGDPADIPETCEVIRQLIGRLPVFGICLGHQLIARAMGAATYKLHFGHRGGNHPVKRLADGRIEITAQNHSYAVDEASLAGTGLQVTHRNLLDGTVEGMACPGLDVFSVQYHPESAPGPQDSSYLFAEFFRLMEQKEGQQHAEAHGHS